ncbi:glucan biosynthesis protein [Arhodomonas aquaeolei]|uniref:glucan biosynthesis protein n=1 Tax=Arhodomonas aquaeolei TaxID=2369 RepID=UPI002167C861|nr:glucan biosynthesis protein G [Arhodomonas aquaeolei]MCS4504049.1 glucan biosynthesis protein [Arhodomonas aquaeolei]
MRRRNRLPLIPLVAVVLAAAGHITVASAQDGDDVRVFERVTERARALAGEDYQAPDTALPESLASMDYDAYRKIRFRPDRAIWKGERLFEVQLFHPGFLYNEPVTIHLVENGQVRTLPFDPGLFRYDGGEIFEGEPPQGLGYAGFRLHFPLNRPDYADEVIAFQGASYFRFLGRGEGYGMSARGLAIDTALPSGEEFPRFKAFWLVRPQEGATTVTVFALLDSPSLAGAYRFRIHPGESTRVEVTARLFARDDVQRLGIAPLTSMFFYGENSVRRHDDYRPEVHDSDGLAMHTAGGEWIWRPLTNPRALRESALMDTNPRGFGLLQRDRDFEHYLDAEADYHRRPGMWVEPRGAGWGEGAVHLVELPSDEEVNDNIVAFWSPKDPFEAGESLTLSYELRSLEGAPPGHDLARAVRTRIGHAAIPGTKDKPPKSLRQFIVDFAGGELDGLAGSQPVTAELSQSTGVTQDVTVHRLPDGHWRASFRLAPDGEKPSDLRLFLQLRGERVSETWNYVWDPDALP